MHEVLFIYNMYVQYAQLVQHIHGNQDVGRNNSRQRPHAHMVCTKNDITHISYMMGCILMRVLET